jgi:hypothetical protein
MAFKQIDGHYGNWWVNHKDGVPGHDDLDNLEFCTPSQNVKHAYDNNLHEKKLAPVDALNHLTGKTFSFKTITQCCEALALSQQLVHGRLRASNGRRYSDGWRFKRPYDEWLPLDISAGQLPTSKAVMAKDVFSGIAHIFGTFNDAARYTGNLSGSVRKQAEDEVFAPLNGWVYRYVAGFTGWPRYTSQQLAIFKDNPTKPGIGVEVHNFNDNTVEFFTSVERAAAKFNLSPITVRKMSSGGVTWKNSYKFTAIKIEQLHCPTDQ